ncbi:MAG: hypothetical protein LBC68_03150, partial [Prevotellaceae bacterium]|nr:hypothetical protein [Prevotellaceae bacterium]
MITAGQSAKRWYIFLVCFFIITSSVSARYDGETMEIPALTSPLYPTSICSGSTFQYEATSATSEVTFQWTRPYVSGISEPATEGYDATINETLTNTTELPITVKYVFTLTTSGNIVNTQDVLLTVNPMPVLTSKLILRSECSGDAFDYYVAKSSTPGTTFSWTRTTIGVIPETNGSDSDYISETLVNSTSDSIDMEYIFTLTANGCVNEQTVSVLLKPMPRLSSTLSPASICSGSTFNYIQTNTVANTS